MSMQGWPGAGLGRFMYGCAWHFLGVDTARTILEHGVFTQDESDFPGQDAL